MAFKLTKTYVVAAGVFNIHVVQPEFLKDIGVLSEGAKILIVEADLSQPGFRFNTGPPVIQWQVRPDRLIVVPESHELEFGTMLADVLKALKWTPLIAVNTTLEFDSDLSILDKLQSKIRFPVCKPREGFSLGKTACRFELERKPHQVFIFDVTLNPEAEGNITKRLSLAINCHTQLPQSARQPDANALAQEACRSYRTYFNEAIELASELLGVEVSV